MGGLVVGTSAQLGNGPQSGGGGAVMMAHAAQKSNAMNGIDSTEINQPSRVLMWSIISPK